ncbi:MAG: hypothetical protein R6U40_00120, partial [Desulfobacterales bacterium]
PIELVDLGFGIVGQGKDIRIIHSRWDPDHPVKPSVFWEFDPAYGTWQKVALTRQPRPDSWYACYRDMPVMTAGELFSRGKVYGVLVRDED